MKLGEAERSVDNSAHPQTPGPDAIGHIFFIDILIKDLLCYQPGDFLFWHTQEFC